ncbi:hypothetical protein FBU30_003778 [Linnemannia zychae]|nr:hypothetical protein FBU30_003778 [Linnemannia zychae]
MDPIPSNTIHSTTSEVHTDDSILNDKLAHSQIEQLVLNVLNKLDQYLAKTEPAKNDREENQEDTKMDPEKYKLAIKMEDIKIENDNGIEVEGLNGVVLNKVRGILCSDAEILSSSKYFKRDPDFPFVRLDADVAEFFIRPDRFQAWLEDHQRSISTNFNFLRKYEYNDPDQQYRLTFACQCAGKKRVHGKTVGEETLGKPGKPIKHRVRAPSIKQNCLSRIAALFQPILMADGSRMPGCIVEYRYQHNHSLGDITDLGTRQKSAAIKSTIERLLKQGSSIQRVMQQLTMDYDKFTQITRGNDLFSTDEEYDYLPNAIITDQGGSEILAIKTSFPGVPIFYCAWHVLRVWERQAKSKMTGLGVHPVQKREQIRSQFRSDLRRILYEKDKTIAQELIKTFRETWSDQKELLDYLNKNYFGSYIESWHNTLKRHFFRDNQQRRSDTVIYILAILAVPHFQQKCIRSIVNVGRMNPAQSEELLKTTIALDHIKARVLKGYVGAYIKQASDDTLYVESFTKLGVGYEFKIDFSKTPTGHIIECSCEYFKNHRSCCMHISLVQVELPPISLFRADIWEHQANFHSGMLKPDIKSNPDDAAPEVDQIRFAIQRLGILEELWDKKAEYPQRMLVQTKLQEALDLFEASFPRYPGQNLNNKRPRQQ